VASIYISSTYTDLQSYRASSIAALRKAGHHIETMEDYVASGKYPPLKKCLDDVTHCDYYVGIFAWRYGYIPKENNASRKSITELEFRKAFETGKPQFIFLLEDTADWLEESKDTITGEGNAGDRIKTLRDELCRDKLTSFFKTPDELASLVVASVSKWEVDKAQRQQQQYAESNDLEEISLDIQRIKSLNKSLRLTQEIRNKDAKSLTENQMLSFIHLKGKSWEISQLNNEIKKLDQKAQALVLDIRTRLDQESQALARKISQDGIENSDPKQIESCERIETSISDFKRELERGEKVAQWLKNQRQALVDDGIQAVQKTLESQPNLLQETATVERINTLKREVEQYLRRLAVASSLGRTNLLDHAHGLNEFSQEIYTTFFEYIKARKVQTSSELLRSQQNLLITYIDHLISHVFTEP